MFLKSYMLCYFPTYIVQQHNIFKTQAIYELIIFECKTKKYNKHHGTLLHFDQRNNDKNPKIN